MNSYRNLSTNQTRLNKNLEKLSTGYKVNRAADDAAGLAISEKMRAQISGLEQATKNAKDGMSLIQTAEGALTEVHDMLNRMVTLAEQSANGTYDDTVDRFQLQKEVDALKEEIDRVAESTNYNGIKLLDGSLSGKGNVKGAVTVEGIDATKAVSATTALGQIGTANDDAKELKENDKVTYNVSWKDAEGKDHSTTVEFKVGTDNGATKTNTALIASDGTKYKLNTEGQTESKAGGDLQKAVIAELNKNTDFSANFKATSSTTTDIQVGTTPHSSGQAVDSTSVAGGITITSLKEGTAGAVVKSVELAYQTWDKDSDKYQESTVVGGSTVVASVSRRTPRRS
jgi:flagellin